MSDRWPFLVRVATALAVAPLAAAPLAVAPLASLSAQETRRDVAFTWSAPAAAGQQLFLRNINGPIEVERSTSGRLEVQAEKRWRRGDPESVRIEQQRSGEHIVICALFNPDATCHEEGIRGGRQRWRNEQDVSVRFMVRVPDGVRVEMSTVNGAVSLRDVVGPMIASTVNGGIQARNVSGALRAKTVNGGIDAVLTALGTDGELEYETVNGGVTLTLPANAGLQLELSTVNGRVSTDFPITVSGTLSPRRLRGTIGDGRTRLRAATVNGSVALRKGS